MIYLDNAATTFPKPPSVIERVSGVMRSIGGSPGRASHRMALEAGRVIFEAREKVAGLIGAKDSSRVVFTKNATEAINIALKGLLSPGDHVITTTIEHSSVANTVDYLESTGVEVTRLSPDAGGFIAPGSVGEAIKDNTRLVCLSHASNVFGAVQDAASIGAVCGEKEVLFMLDGAQTVGALPVDVATLGVDVLAGTGHKALFGPQGTGFLYLGEGVEPATLIHGGTGWYNTEVEVPERLEAGTMNTPGIGGLAAGVEFIEAEGIERIRAHESSMMKALLEGLASNGRVRIIGTPGADRRVALVAFNIDGIAPAELGTRLDNEFSIMVRSGTHCAPYAHREAGTFPDGAVRVSPGYLNTGADIEAFLAALARISAG